MRVVLSCFKMVVIDIENISFVGKIESLEVLDSKLIVRDSL